MRGVIGARRRRPTSWSRRAASACSTTSCSTARCARRGPDALAHLLGRRRAGDAGRDARQRRSTRCGARCRELDLVLTYGGGPPVVAAYEALGARALRADLQRARSRRRIIPVPPEPRFAADLALPRQPPAGPRGAGRGVLPRRRPPRLPEQTLPARRQRLGRQADAGERARRSAMSARATTTPSTARRSRC